MGEDIFVMSQHTISENVNFSGKGIHSGSWVNMLVQPAEANSGIIFVRSDLDGLIIEAKHHNVINTYLSTVLGGVNSSRVRTVEHFLSACSGLGIDNLIVNLDADEVPALDGSSKQFTEGLIGAKLVNQKVPKKYIEILDNIMVSKGNSFGYFSPSKSSIIDISISFPDTIVGEQHLVVDLDKIDYQSEISRARTFGSVKDVEKLWASGYALGSSLKNSIAFDGMKIINPEGLIYKNEFVRHKILDCIGDLYLSGAKILGKFMSQSGGHTLNHLMLDKLFSTPKAWRYVNIVKSLNQSKSNPLLLDINRYT